MRYLKERDQDSQHLVDIMESLRIYHILIIEVVEADIDQDQGHSIEEMKGIEETEEEVGQEGDQGQMIDIGTEIKETGRDIAMIEEEINMDRAIIKDITIEIEMIQEIEEEAEIDPEYLINTINE